MNAYWKITKFFLPALILLLLSSAAFAGPVNDGIVPKGCQAGCPCTLCDLYQLGKNLIDIALYLSVPIAAALFLWGGFLLLASGGNESQISRGKKVLTDTVVGLALAFFAWVLINTLLSTLVFKISFQEVLRGNYWWNPPACQTGSKESCKIPKPGTKPTGEPPGPVGEPPGPGGQPPGPTGGAIDGNCLKDGFDICSGQAVTLLNEPPEGRSWDQNTKNTQVIAERLAPYEEQINAMAEKYGVPPERIKAIIAAESAGNNNATHQDLDGQSSFGLMQIRPDTARAVDPRLAGLSDSEVETRLRDPNYNIEIGTAYYSDLLNKYVGDKNLASAAYNGGPGANRPSVNCPGALRWQCEWDSDGCYNTGRTDCKPNAGYRVTRQYVGNLNNMEQQFRGV